MRSKDKKRQYFAGKPDYAVPPRVLLLDWCETHPEILGNKERAANFFGFSPKKWKRVCNDDEFWKNESLVEEIASKTGVAASFWRRATELFFERKK